MKKLLIVLCILMVAAFGNAQKHQFVLNDTIHSDILKSEQRIIVYLPPNYYEVNDEYPLQVLFGYHSRTKAVTSISEYLSLSSAINSGRLHSIPEAITVDVGRANLYGDRFIEFVNNELIPFIEEKYAKCNYKTLIGHSSEATYSILCMLQENNPFNACIATAPAFPDDFLESIDTSETKENFLKGKHRIYLSYSPNDKVVSVQNQENVIKWLAQIKNENLIVNCSVKPEDNHHSILISSLPEALLFIYDDWAFFLPEENSGNAVEQFLFHFQELSAKRGVEIKPPEFDFYLMTYLLDYRKEYEQKINMLESCKKKYPNAIMADAYLARTYYFLRQLEKAKEHNNMAKKINPNNQFIEQTERLLKKL